MTYQRNGVRCWTFRNYRANNKSKETPDLSTAPRRSSGAAVEMDILWGGSGWAGYGWVFKALGGESKNQEQGATAKARETPDLSTAPQVLGVCGR